MRMTELHPRLVEKAHAIKPGGVQLSACCMAHGGCLAQGIQSDDLGAEEERRLAE